MQLNSMDIIQIVTQDEIEWIIGKEMEESVRVVCKFMENKCAIHITIECGKEIAIVLWVLNRLCSSRLCVW